MNQDYPIILRLEGKRCVVVGGGEVALRKVEALLECGAAVHVIAPQLHRKLVALVKANRIQHINRPYRRGDVKDAFLAIGATDDTKVNQQLQAEAEKRRILVNIVDQPDLCSFTLPARVRRGAITIAISTGGESPALARRLREVLEEAVGPEYGQMAKLLGSLRREVKQRFATETERKAAWNRILDSNILDLLKQGKTKEARASARQCLSSTETDS